MNVIDSVPLFGSLTDSQRELLWGRMILEQRKAGEHLYTQGDPATKMYLVKSGWVRLVSDQHAVLANVSQGSLLGDADLLLGHDRGTTAEALTELEAWGLSEDDLADVVAQAPEIGLQLSAIYRTTVVPLLRYLVERRLRPIPGMSDLPDTVLATVAGRLCVHDAPAGEVLFTAGRAPASLYIVDTGRVSMGQPDLAAGEFAEGELVAERNVLLGRAHTMTARALTDCRLWELSVSDLEKLCALYPDLRAILSRAVQSRLDETDRARAVSLLRSTPIFQSLPADALNELAGRLVWQMAPGGMRIFEAAALAETMYLVDGGGVELLNQRNEPLARISSGGYFGEAGLAGGAPYGYAAVARGNTTLWALSERDVAEVATRYPAVRRLVTDYLTTGEAATAEHFAERHLRRLTLFAGLTAEQLAEVAGHLTEARFRVGQPVYLQGQPADALYLIEEGRVTVQAQTSEGGVRELAALGPGDFSGETALLTGQPHATDVLAQTDVTAWALSRDDFETLLMRYPVLALNLSRALSYRLRVSDQQAAARPPEARRSVVAPAAAAAAVAASAASAAIAPAPAPAPAKPVRTRPVPAPAKAAAPERRGLAGAFAWFGSQGTATKVQLIALALLLIWLIGIAAPSLVISMLSSRNNTQNAQNGRNGFLNSTVLIAMAAGDEQQADATATYTPWPTDTPIPSPTPTFTPLPTPTNTPIPATATNVPTATPVPPTATPIPPTPNPTAVAEQQAARAEAAKVAAAAAAAAAAPTAKPKAARQFTINEVYHLTPCENGGKHNIFLVARDPAGNPVDGLKMLLYSGDMATQLGATLTGSKGPGLAEFDIYKGGAYAVVASTDGSNPGDSDIAAQLSSVRDLNGNPFPSSEKCDKSGDDGNMWGHNSWRVTFVKNW